MERVRDQTVGLVLVVFGVVGFRVMQAKAAEALVGQ